MPAQGPSRAPRWYGIPMRVLLVTFIGTLLSFAVSLLLGILGMAVIALIRRSHVNMTIAYRDIALPAALAAGAVILISVVIVEIRHYRQTRALLAIERLS